MQLMVDPTTRQKLVAVKNANRSFVLEYPADSDTAELYGVVNDIKKQLWTALEAEMKAEVTDEEKPKPDAKYPELEAKKEEQEPIAE